MFFSTAWARFDIHFKTILESLANHSDLVDREALSINITEARLWRSKAVEENAERERKTAALQRQAVISWFKYDEPLQEDELCMRLGRTHPDTCHWIIQNTKMKAWAKHGLGHRVLWIKGKPGSGNTANLLSPRPVDRHH